MAYTPPAHDVVVFNGDSSAYTPPAHDVVIFAKDSVALGGNSLYAALGALYPLINGALTSPLSGKQVLVSTGTVGPLINGAIVSLLSSTSVTTSRGSLVSSISVSLTGCSINVANGLIGVSENPLSAVTWNPADKDSDITLSNQDMTASSATPFGIVRATSGRTTGKWYFEGQWTGRISAFGLADGSSPLNNYLLSITYGWGGLGHLTGPLLKIVHDGTLTDAGSFTYVAGHVFQIAVDLDADKFWVGYDGTWLNGGDPVAGTNPGSTTVTSPYSGGVIYPAWNGWDTDVPTFVNARFQAVSFSYTPPSGFLPWDPHTSLTVALSSVALAVTSGVIVGNSPVAVLNGVSVIASLGAVQYSDFFGKQVSVSTGVLGVQSSISVGNPNNTLQDTPRVLSAFLISGSAQDPFRTNAWWSGYHNSFMSLEGKLRGVGESFWYDLHSSAFIINWDWDFRARFNYAIDQNERLLGADSSSTLTETADYNRGGDSTYKTYQTDQNSPVPTHIAPPWYLNPGGQYEYNVGAGQAFGGWYSIGLDGSIHWLHERSKYPEFTDYLIYQNSFRTSPYPAVIPLVKPDDQQTSIEYAGLYAHDANTAYVFYENQGTYTYVDLPAPVAWDGKLATSPLSAQAGMLGVQIVQGGNTSLVVPLVGTGVVASAKEFWKPRGLAYRRWDGTSWSHKLVVRDPTGQGEFDTDLPVNHEPLSITAVRSGYNDIVYIVYVYFIGLSTWRYGLLVMNGKTGEMYSHSRKLITLGNQHTLPRPIADVAKLSNGTSVTQFGAYGSGVVHMSWTSSTALTPTFVAKTRPVPTQSYGHAPVETLEIRGDVVQHVVYEFEASPADSTATTMTVYYRTNDATTSSTTWAARKQLFTWVDGVAQLGGIAGGWLSGYGSGYQPYLWYSNDSTHIGRAWVDFWGGMSVPTTCAVGRVTVSFDNTTLLSKTVTVVAGLLSIQNSPSIALTGIQVTVGNGVITSLIGGASIALIGAQVSVQTGSLTCTISQTLVGSSVTAQRGALVTAISVPLVGQTLSAASGTLTPNISLTLTSQLFTAQRGFLGTVLSSSLSGVQVVVGKGGFQTGITFRLTGAYVSVAQGLLVPALSITLAGKTFPLSLGSFGQRIDVNLLDKVLTIEIGAFGVHSDITLTVSGVETTGQVGVLPTDTNVPKPTADMLLWARMEVEKLVTKIETTALFNDTDEMQ